MKKVVILDRDGTIIKDKEYIYKIEELEFIPNSLEALKTLKNNEFKLIVYTNQSGIGRKYYTKEEYENFNDYFMKYLKKNDIKLEKTFFCPHIKKDDCNCRKPKIKLMNDYLIKEEIVTEESYVIGDKTSDIKFGENLKIKSILLKTGKSGKDKEYDVKPTFIANDLLGASKIIIKNGKNK